QQHFYARMTMSAALFSTILLEAVSLTLCVPCSLSACQLFLFLNCPSSYIFASHHFDHLISIRLGRVGHLSPASACVQYVLVLLLKNIPTSLYHHRQHFIHQSH